MSNSLGAALASFIFVFLKAFQQRNVAFDHYRWIIPISLLMALTEVYVIAIIIKVGYHLGTVIAIGLGSGTGALIAAILHKRYLTREAPNELQDPPQGRSASKED